MKGVLDPDNEKIKKWFDLIKDLSIEDANNLQWEYMKVHCCDHCDKIIENKIDCYNTRYGLIVIGIDGEPHIFCTEKCWENSIVRLRIVINKIRS